MADDGTGDDLWANTKPEADTGSTPPLDPDATTVQPGVGGPPPPGIEPTTVQPTVVPPAAAGGGLAGPPPGAPPAGEPDEPLDWRPPWLIPALAALLIALIVGLIAVLASRGDDGDTDDTTTTSTSEVPADTEPVFIPVDSGGDATTTAPATTVEGATTVPPTTQPPPATEPPATQPPATEPPATEPPATEPPATDPPVVGPEPGFALVDGENLEIRVACRVAPSPDTDRELVSYVVENSSGRIVIERWFESGDNGVDVDLVSSGNRASAGATDGATVTDPFEATATGDVTIEVAVNPPGAGVDDCIDVVETTSVDTGLFRAHLVLDVCTVGDDVAGIATEGLKFGAIDNGDDTAQLTISDRTGGPLTDPAAIVDKDETIVTYVGSVTGGGRGLDVLIDLDLAGPRACGANETP